MQNESNFHPKIIRKDAVLQRTGWSKSTLVREIKKGNFIQPIQLGSRSIGFIESELDEWIVNKMSKRSSESNFSEPVSISMITTPTKRNEEMNFA